MSKVRRGGYRQPANPAYVATPQGGQRTDGGPASKKQPIRRLPDAGYGENKAFVEAQQQASLPDNTQRISPNVLSPQTERAGEVITEGNPIGPGAGPTLLPDDIQIIGTAMLQLSYSEVVADLLNS